MRFKRLLIIAAIIVIVVVAGISYLGISFRSLITPPAKPGPPPVPYMAVNLLGTDLLSYDYGQDLIPYALISYTARNLSSVYVNATLLRQPPPRNIYILNVSNSCPFNCQNLFGIIAAVRSDLALYGLVANASDVPLISQQNLQTMPNDSVLIVLSSALPYEMLSNMTGTNETLLQFLMDKGTDMVYVGGNFSYATQGPILVKVQTSTLPLYLYWNQKNVTYPRSNDSFYFSKSTYSFVFGHRYGPLTYINYTNGSILAFPGYLNSWSSAGEAGQDIAKAVSQSFWLQRYATGNSGTNLTSFANSSGRLGVVMSHLSPGFNYNYTRRAPPAYGRAVVYTSNSYSIGNSSDIYKYATYQESFAVNGTVSISPTAVPGAQIIPIPTVTFFVPASPRRQVYSPHIDIYSANFTRVQTIPVSSFNASSNITLIEPTTPYLPPGQYVLQVLSFYDNQYAAGLFNISPIEITLTRANYTNGTFIFSLKSANVTLNGINYTVLLNKLYPESGVLQNGTLTYSLPKGTPEVHGNLTFSIEMLSTTFKYHKPAIISVTSIPTQYIEVAVVIIVMFILVTVVRAPNRDEFYVDVPSFREAQKIPIKLKANDVVSAFDKLNIYYRWKMMPLSVEEARVAVASNLRYNNMSISLTHSNIEALLNQLASAGYLVSADGLYAPKGWVTQGHDIEYLAAFKKLRIYLVTHAYVFTDIDTSDKADMIATVHNERIYIVIYSKTSKFQRVPVFAGTKTYLAFLNSYKMEEFQNQLRESTSAMAEELRMYISAGKVRLVDADNPEELLT